MTKQSLCVFKVLPPLHELFKRPIVFVEMCYIAQVLVVHIVFFVKANIMFTSITIFVFLLMPVCKSEEQCRENEFHFLL